MGDFYQDVILARRSVRKFREKPVSKKTILRLLEAANAAPSAHNTQPWHFCVVTSNAAKRSLAQRMGQAWAKPLLTQGLSQEAASQKIAASVSFFAGVPALLVVFQKMAEPLEDPNSLEHTLGRQSVAAAATQLLLAASALGLGACWYCLPLHCPGVFQRFFPLGENHRPEALITLGYPAAGETRREKRPAEELCTFY